MTTRLWTPWRGNYVTQTMPKVPGCVFCNAPNGNDDRTNLVLFRGNACYLIMNLFPYNTGHLMAVPYEHVGSLPDLDPAVRAEMFDLATFATIGIQEVMRPDGFNMGMNLGEAAGAGIAAHLHLHVVPRWKGDSNFMPVLADTKVMPETILQTYDRLKPVLESLAAR